MENIETVIGWPSPSNAPNSLGRTQIEQARSIAKSLGVFTAARYMAKRGWSLDATRFVLLGV